MGVGVAITRQQVDAVQAALADGSTREDVATRLGLPYWTVVRIAQGRIKGKETAPAEQAETWVAACMDREEWWAWQDTNRRLAVGEQASRPCTDCLAGYAADMRAEGRCNGQPAGDHREEEYEMDEIVTEVPAARQTRAVRIAVTAPCPACTHQQVCRIADEVRAIEATSVQVPKVGTGLALELSAAVSCEFFAPERKTPRKHDWSDEQRAAAAERARALAATKKAKATAKA